MITLNDIPSVLDNTDPAFLEDLAQRARKTTEQFFGRTISLYAPLYLSNYCSSHCTYCGFKSKNRIQRFKLTAEEMHREMQYLAEEGIENILLLTGESYKITPVFYLKEAVQIAKRYFPSISLEVHPMEENDYRELFLYGVDGITVYQETYDREIYKRVHLSGLKSDYDYRRATPERAAAAGVRHISMGILLGLAEPAEDLSALYEHLRFMEKHFPGVEYSLSFPRLKTIKGIEFAACAIDDPLFIKILCLTRLQFPRVGINLSTREKPELRDHLLELGITRMSAGSNTSVGGYTLKEATEQDPQFDIADERSLKEVVQMLKERNFDPVFTDWRRIPNEPLV